MHAAYVLLLELHTCRLHICAACEQEGTNWSCVHQDFLDMCSTHLLAVAASFIHLRIMIQVKMEQNSKPMYFDNHFPI